MASQTLFPRAFSFYSVCMVLTLTACDSGTALVSSFTGYRPKQTMDNTRRAPLLNATPAVGAPVLPVATSQEAPSVITVRTPALQETPAPVAAPVAPVASTAPAAPAAQPLQLASAADSPPPARFGAPTPPPVATLETPYIQQKMSGWLGQGAAPAQPSAAPVQTGMRKHFPGNPSLQPPAQASALPYEAAAPSPQAIPAPLPFAVASPVDRAAIAAAQEKAQTTEVEKPAVEKKTTKKTAQKTASRKSKKHYSRAHGKSKTAAVKKNNTAKKSAANKVEVADQKTYPSLNNVPAKPPELDQVKQAAPQAREALENARTQTQEQKKALDQAPFESLQQPEASAGATSSSSGASVPNVPAPALPEPPAPPALPAPILPPPAPSAPSSSGAAKAPAASSSSSGAPVVPGGALPIVPAPEMPTPPPPPPPPAPPGASSAPQPQPSLIASLLPEWVTSRAGRYMPEPHYVAQTVMVHIGRMLMH